MKRTYADEAKKIMNKYKLRLGEKFDKGDALALKAMNQELAALRDRQENDRAKLNPKQQTGLPEAQYGRFLPLADTKLTDPIGTNSLAGFQDATRFGAYDDPSEFGGFASLNSDVGSGLTSPSLSTEPSAFKSRVPWLGAVASGLGSILANRQLDLPTFNPETVTPNRVGANLVSYERGRQGIARERDVANALIRRSARSTGSRAGLMEGTLAGLTGTQRGAGQQLEQSIESEANTNAQIRNQTSQFNAAQQARAQELNARNAMLASQVERENFLINSGRRDNQITGITDALTGYGKDLLAANQYDQMVGMMAPDNYQLTAGKDSLFRRIFQISPDGKITFRNTGDKA